MKKILIGVSGGPDSMYLLNKLSNDGQHDIHVAHVNYHLREESGYDEKTVIEYCKNNNIKYSILDVKKENWDAVYYLKNKQSMARETRYNFYLELAHQLKIKDLYIAHQKDDFLETAIMQLNRSDDYLFYGIKETSIYKGITIHRPLLHLYKSEIIKLNNDNGVPYALDKTNDLPIYERNKLRIELKEKCDKDKDFLVSRYKKINLSKEKLNQNVDIAYDEWESSNFSYDCYIKIDAEIKKYVIYKFLINSEKRINISKDKLEGIIDFLKNKKGDKEYRLMEDVFLIVKSNIITILIK